MQAIRRLALAITTGGSGPLASVLNSVFVQFAFLILSMGTGVLTARLLGPEGRGMFAAVTSMAQFMGGLAVAGFGSAIVVMLRQADSPGLARTIAGNAIILALATSLLAAAAGVVITPFTLPGYSAEAVLVAQFSMLGVFATSLQIVYRQTFAGYGAYRRLNLLMVLPQLCYLIALVLWTLMLPLTALSAALLLLATNFVAVVLFTPSFARAARPDLGREGWPHLRKFGSYVQRAGGQDLVMVISGTTDRLMLIPFVPVAELGLYAVAIGFARVISVIHPAIGTILLSTMSQKSDKSALKVLHDRAFRFGLLVLAVIIGVTFLIDRILIQLLYGQDFVAATGIFRVLVIESGITCLVAITTQTFMAWNRPGLVSTTFAGSLIVFFAVAALSIPAHGAMGAAWALVAGSLTRLVFLLALFPLKLGQRLPRLTLDGADLDYVRRRLAEVLHR